MNPENTLYAVLGVAASASAAEIEAAHAARAQLLQGDADALSLLRVACDTLRDPVLRAAYDRKLVQRQAAVAEPPPIVFAETTGARPRSRLRNWLVFFLAGGGVAGALLLSSPKAVPVVTPPPPPPVVPAAGAAAPLPEPAAAEPAEPAADPDAGEPQAAVAEASPPGLPAAAAAAPVPTRGAKRPGFDAQYVAWSVFTIRQRNKSGSGVLIGPDRILTNCHVLAGGASNGLIAVNGMTKRISKVEKYARLDGEDACLLFAPGAGNDSIAWGDSAALRPGDTVHALGHPGGSSDIAWSEGSFRQRSSRGGETFLITDNYCRPGSSGGPLVDNEGRLVGIVTAVQRFVAKGGEAPAYGACISVTEATARALLARPLFPIALAPAQYLPNH